MATTASRATVAAPVETVWEALASFADISRWSHRRPGSLLTVGRPVRVTRRVQVGRSALRETVDEWEPGSASATASRLPAVVRSAHNTWQLAARARARTSR